MESENLDKNMQKMKISQEMRCFEDRWHTIEKVSGGNYEAI